MIKRVCTEERVDPSKVTLHSDNGSPMKGSTMLATLQSLGVTPSFSRPSVSNDNPFSESLFKTLKYVPFYPKKPFDSLDSASEWVSDFVTWYNDSHLHSGIKYVTPSSRHKGLDKDILLARKNVYELAKLKTPNRWSGSTRDWTHQEKVSINEGNKSAI